MNIFKIKFIRRWLKRICYRELGYEKFGWDRYFLKYYIPHEEKLDKYSHIFFGSDPVRYSTLFLAIQTIARQQIPGAFSELGVYKGETSKIIHELAPERRLYLFDTFEGFPSESLDDNTQPDQRFQNTSLEQVKMVLGNSPNLIFRPGYFPETAKGLEDERFAFIMLDVDKYHPTRDGLEFFYQRLNVGGYLFIHDYNSSESDWGVSRAVNEYFSDCMEIIIEIPDVGGSVVIRKRHA